MSTFDFEIKARFSGNVLFTAKLDVSLKTESACYQLGAAVKLAVAGKADLSGADLSGADLRSADLRSADLSGADLSGAYLRSADLRSADLRSADLSGADLRSADLSGAYLRSAKGLAPEVCTDLLMLLDQPGKIRAYKLVTASGTGPTYPGINYEVGKPVSVENACTDVDEHCAAGVNVATLGWCLKEWKPGMRILVVEFEAKDIAAIPTATDGKFRLHRCDVVGEKTLDYVALGLMKAPETKAA